MCVLPFSHSSNGVTTEKRVGRMKEVQKKGDKFPFVPRIVVSRHIRLLGNYSIVRDEKPRSIRSVN